MQYKDAVESRDVEESVVIAPETLKLIKKAVKKHAPKRPTLRGAGMTEDAYAALELALTAEKKHPQDREGKARSFQHLTRLADKMEGVGPYATHGPIPKDKFDIQNWVDEYEEYLPEVVSELRNYYKNGVSTILGYAYKREKTETEIASDRKQANKIVRKALADLLTNTNTCGTTGCACGYAAVDPYFIKLGLRLNEWASIDDEQIERVFYINGHRVSLFFMPDSYEGRGTPKQVAVRIRHFLGSAYFDEVRNAA